MKLFDLLFHKRTEYIIIGDHEYLEDLFSSFDKIIDYISYILDDEKPYGYFGEFEVYGLDFLSKINTKNFKYVIFGRDSYSRIKKKLTSKYNIDEENILSGSEWVLYLLKNTNDVILYPKELRLELCSICQLNCVACYMRKYNYGTTGKGVMKYAVVKNLLDKYPFVKAIEISNNGEPFLNPELDKIFKYAYDHGIKVTCSNGANFNNVPDKVLEALVKYKVSTVTISLDGATNETYQQYRVNGDINKVIANVKKVNEYKKKYKTKYPHLVWKYILMEHNECDVEKAIKMAKELNMQIAFFLDWRGFTPKNPQKIEKLTGLNFTKKCKPQLYQDFCMQMIKSPQINWDGRLFGCCMTYDTDWGKNVFKEGLIESVNSDYYRHAIYKLLGDETDYNEENQCNTRCNTYDSFIKKGDHVEL